jgi:predicted RNA methylase
MVQVDSVGRDDRIIPANVARAANLFQRNGWFIRGEPEIRAEDQSRTEVIGNFEFDYRNKKIDLSEVSWMKKIFRSAHTRMDFDPAVWAMVEELIVKEIERLNNEKRD